MGVSVRRICTAIDPILKGEQLCWNYGRKRPECLYLELRPKAAREFVNAHELQALFKAYKEKCSTLELLGRGEKLRYIADGHSTLFGLLLDSSVSKAKVEDLIRISGQIGRIPYSIHKIVDEQLVKEAETIIKYKNALAEYHPTLAVQYWAFLKELSAEVSFGLLLDIALGINSNLKIALKDVKAAFEGGKYPIAALRISLEVWWRQAVEYSEEKRKSIENSNI
jgi:hypothetical protein